MADQTDGTTVEKEKIFADTADRKRLLAKLESLGVTDVAVGFSGSGDSGSIDGITFFNDGKEVDVSDTTLEWGLQESKWCPGTNSWTHKRVLQNMSLPKVLEEVTYQALESCGLDWYNNDGGQGTFFIRVAANEFELDIGINYTQTDDHQFSF